MGVWDDERELLCWMGVSVMRLSRWMCWAANEIVQLMPEVGREGLMQKSMPLLEMNVYEVRIQIHGRFQNRKIKQLIYNSLDFYCRHLMTGS